MKIFKATYSVEDGYAGPSRPQGFDIGSDDVESEMTDSDLGQLFDELMQMEFEQCIYPYPGNKDEFIEWAKSIQEEDASCEEQS